MREALGRGTPHTRSVPSIDNHLLVILAFFPIICWLGGGDEVLAPGGGLVEGIPG